MSIYIFTILTQIVTLENTLKENWNRESGIENAARNYREERTIA